MSRTGKGLLGAPKVPTGRRLIAQPSSSSLGPWFWGALHIAAHQVHLLSTLGWGWSAQGKTSGSRPTHSDADHVYLTSPLYSCLASHRRLRAFPHAPVVTMVTIHLADASQTTSEILRKIQQFLLIQDPQWMLETADGTESYI